MKFLKSSKTNLSKNKSVKALLHRNMRGWGDPHETSILHASDVSSIDKAFCPREFALLDIVPGVRDPFWVDTALRATFDTGRAIETLLREKWIGDHAVGTWRCLGCRVLTDPLVSRPKGCSTLYCKGLSWEYVETRIESKKYGISAGIDLVIAFEDGTLRIVEIKIMDKNLFKDLKAPLAEHRDRVNLYLLCAEDGGHPYSTLLDTEIGHIVYVSRSHGFKDDSLRDQHGILDIISPFKEFRITKDLASIQSKLERAESLKRFRETKVLPEGVCASSYDSRARECSRRKECFSGTYPAGGTLP